MKDRIQKNGKRLIVKIPQEVDHCFTDEIRDQIDRRLQTEDLGELEFDFLETEFMDSSGIGLLMGRYQLMRALGGTVVITNAGERIRKIFVLSGIHKIISIKKEL